jgi:hypothetical protein
MIASPSKRAGVQQGERAARRVALAGHEFQERLERPQAHRLGGGDGAGVGRQREDPTAVPPRADGVAIKPAPERSPADFGHQAALDYRTARRISAIEKRESGLPWTVGSSQASAFTSTTTLGGKARRGAATCLLFESRQALFMEALTPLADDLPRRIEPRGDDVVGEALGGIEDDLGTDHIPIR